MILFSLKGLRRLHCEYSVPSAATDFGTRLDTAFHWTLARDPSKVEVEAIGQYFDRQRTRSHAGAFPGATAAGFNEAEAAAWAAVSSALLNLDEFITRE